MDLHNLHEIHDTLAANTSFKKNCQKKKRRRGNKPIRYPMELEKESQEVHYCQRNADFEGVLKIYLFLKCKG